MTQPNRVFWRIFRCKSNEWGKWQKTKMFWSQGSCLGCYL